MERPDQPFDAERRRLLGPVLKAAAFDGFTHLSLRAAARAAGISDCVVAAAFPRGPIDLIQFWSSEADRAAAVVADESAVSLKIRDKIAAAVEARLSYLRPHKEAARRAAAYLALPHNLPTAARLAWNTADAIWRALGDKSTDYNFYSKRAILSGVWTSTAARWLADGSDGEAETKTFLRARINNVMQFEKFKSKFRDSGFDSEGMFGWLAKIRYPADR